MKYCINCGAEMDEGINFCGRCGAPVGQVPKQGQAKKKGVIIGVSFGGIILAVVVVWMLFAMGLWGNKSKTVQSDTDVRSERTVPEAGGELTTDGGELTPEKGESDELSERSKVSENLSTLDVVYSALCSAVANAGANAGSGTIADVAAIGAGSNEVERGIVENLGDVSGIRMVSEAGRGNPVQCKWDVNTSEIKVWAGGDNDDGAICKYGKDGQGNPMRLIVER